MALIYRSVMGVDGDELVNSAPSIFSDWVSRKARESIEITEGGDLVEVGEGLKAASSSAGSDAYRAFRARLVEARTQEFEREEIKTTMTAISSEQGDSWFWVDIERETDQAFGPRWVTYAPGLVTTVLNRFDCHNGDNGFPREASVLEGDQGKLLFKQLAEPDRKLPFVVVSHTRDEREAGLGQSLERARILHRHLAGIAPVYLLGTGAVQEFSKALYENDFEDMDVHSGAIRTYLPGIGSGGQARHRFVQLDRFRSRRDPVGASARFVARNVITQATHQGPPEPWRTLGELPEFQAGAVSDPDWDAFQADSDRQALRIAELEEAVDQLELAKLGFLEEHAELMSRLDDSLRRQRFAAERLREIGENSEPKPIESVMPEWQTFEDVINFIDDECELLVVGDRARKAAPGLDRYDDSENFAARAGRAVKVLQGYAEFKRSGGSRGLRDYCENEAEYTMQGHWIAMKESETTENAAKFKAARTFEVDPDVDPTGQVYMESHIKVVPGGSPSPRIHFFDDTSGATKKVHIGWIGDHLPNVSTN